jgi:hypothetical protein
MLNDPDIVRKLQMAMRRYAKANYAGYADKQASVADFYQEHVGRHPLRDIAATAAVGAAGAYTLSGPVLGLIAKLGGLGNPTLAALAQKYTDDPAGAGSAKLKLAALGALLGAGYGAFQHVDTNYGLAGVKNSLTDKDYWKKNPIRDIRRGGKLPSDEVDMLEMLDVDTSKEAYDYNDPDDTYYDENIYVPSALHAVQSDPVLLKRNRNIVSGLVASSSDGRNKTSGYRLTSAALRAGVGYGSAWALGQGLGSLLSMPAPIVNRLSQAGGIAAAVVGSGVLKEL